MTILTAAESLADLVGNTALLKLQSLSQLTQCEIFVKCEFQNPGGSVKDRAALQMVLEAEQSGKLKPGMTIVEGTAGNTGIGLAVVAKSRGYNLKVVMPKGQAKEKEQLIELHGAELVLVDAVPFANENHFYHTARRIAEQNPDYWWADQFENTANSNAHFLTTGPEIFQQTDGQLDCFVSVAGTGGTLGGISKYLKQKDPNTKIVSVDPDGSGILNFLMNGKHQATAGSSFTEGIGIMRLVNNFKQGKIDYGLNLPDSDIVTVANYVRKQDALVLGSSSALNVTAALYCAVQTGPLNGGKPQKIVTIACDAGERSVSKLYNEAFLASKNIQSDAQSIEHLIERYKTEINRLQHVEFNL
ncbi:cysteine synthase A [Psychrosphaera sp. B3R10]|uniref:cysteine synthase A n=2 Tax=Psychrosphaera TaxID=907197 RepID=UPI001C088E1D|nr:MULTISPECIES: cysteine synthase A [unclassified Psychrosphaera]MBU2883849.1 cysteine synthase A [Psychrosphaera sp. I2R16]MBU2989641.1 cysteine synthase A [Psychrosphaera sp. B3R10]